MTVVAGSVLTIVSSLDTVTLAEVTGTAALQMRQDRKYIVPVTQLDSVFGDLHDVHVLEIDGVRRFHYESMYFDTRALVSYCDAARRRPHRFKVRTRSYHDTGHCMLEVKHRDARGRTVKHRRAHDIGDRERLTVAARRFIDGVHAVDARTEAFMPTLATTYRRTTLLSSDGASRATIDTAVEFRSVADGRSTTLGSYAVVETKTNGKPCAIDRILWRAGHRPVTISKYGTGLAALDPGLPANKWNRVLRRYFDWSPTATAPVGSS